MESRLNQKRQIAHKALVRLEDVMAKAKTDEIRDAAIQRFEYTFEALWKAAQAWLSENHGIKAASPKSAIRECWQAGIFDETQAHQALQMATDRNLTSHTYNEQLAETIYSRLAGYSVLMRHWLTCLG